MTDDIDTWLTRFLYSANAVMLVALALKWQLVWSAAAVIIVALLAVMAWRMGR